MYLDLSPTSTPWSIEDVSEIQHLQIITLGVVLLWGFSF